MARIAILMRDLEAGGIQRVMLALAQEMTRAGHAVDLLLLRPPGTVALPAGVRLHPLARARRTEVLRALAKAEPLAMLAYLRRRLPTAARVLPALTAWLDQHRPDALLAGSSWLNLGAVWARRAGTWRGRVVASEHNHLGERLAGDAVSSKHLLPLLMRRGYARADAVVAVAQAMRQDLITRRVVTADHCRVIYNPVRTPEPTYAPPHPWLADRGVPVILTAGRLVRQKNHALLVEAFARLRARRPARLIVLGEGPLRAALQAQASALGVAQDVALPGRVHDVYPWFAHAAAFALSSHYEGLPLVLIEALACGCPVVSTDCPSGPAEILEAGRHGVLVPPGHPDALAAAIERVLDTPPPAGHGRARAAAFGVQHAAEAYLDLLLGGTPACAAVAAQHVG